jgi:pyruvate/2-oxoglutarate dehydrogenase complex dihydrolipoamide acyltransferase (E2) component
VKDKFGEKAKLVAAVKTLATDDLWLGRTNEEKGLEHVSNAKLLRLHATFSLVKEKFGTRQKLIDAIADLEHHAKDDGYKARLSAFPVPRLYDQFRSAEKRAKGAKAAKAAAPAKPEKKAAAPKKAAAEKKPAAEKKAAAPKKAAAKKLQPLLRTRRRGECCGAFRL